jgi:hypothetical protein
MTSIWRPLLHDVSGFYPFRGCGGFRNIGALLGMMAFVDDKRASGDCKKKKRRVGQSAK